MALRTTTSADLAAQLGETGYLADDELATVLFLALRMQRPLLLEGEPGTGKTALAEAVAESLDLPLIRLQCYEGIDATQALYDWDFPRQILHLRALEAVHGQADVEETEKSLYDERFLLARPVLQALQQAPAVLFVDEVDRADDEFEAFLLEVLSTYQVSIPELGTVAAAEPPVVVLTSNRTRELHDALKRRCLYHWIEHPGLDREVQIVRSRAPEVSDTLARQVVGVVQQLRAPRRPAQAARRGRDPRLGARPAAPRHRRPRPRVGGQHARRAGEVPRGRRPGQAGPRPDALHMTTATRERAGDEILLGFARAVRAAGVPVTSDRAQGFLAATALVGAGDHVSVRRAGRATLCAGPDDLERFEQVFAAFFDHRAGLPRARPASSPSQPVTSLPESEPDGGEGEVAEDEDVIRAAASAAEVLRHRDVAALSAGEKQRLAALFERLECRPPVRRTARHRRWHRGDVDAQRTLRASLRRMGEPAEIAWRRRATRPRRVVLLVDVSGSMSGYADALLRLAHRWTRTGGSAVETFTLGTRLTHVTRAMRLRDPDRAIVAAGETVPDWSGGTRLGETLQMFLTRWGQRGLARGAVVVVFSDGWERGGTELLAEQMERLGRVAHRVVWVNPHRGKAGYEPVQAGVRAALPHCDDFVAGHSLATFAELTELVSRA